MIVCVAVTVTDEVTVEVATLLLGPEQAARKIANATIAAATFPPCIVLSPCFQAIAVPRADRSQESIAGPRT